MRWDTVFRSNSIEFFLLVLARDQVYILMQKYIKWAKLKQNKWIRWRDHYDKRVKQTEYENCIWKIKILSALNSRSLALSNEKKKRIRRGKRPLLGKYYKFFFSCKNWIKMGGTLFISFYSFSCDLFRFTLFNQMLHFVDELFTNPNSSMHSKLTIFFHAFAVNILISASSSEWKWRCSKSLRHTTISLPKK